MSDLTWPCPDCGISLKDDLYAQFGLWCPHCERVIPWRSFARVGVITAVPLKADDE